MSSIQLKYFEAAKAVTIYHIDAYNGIAYPKENAKGRHLRFKEGKIFKGFGQVKRFKLFTGEKVALLLLHTGDAVRADSVRAVTASELAQRAQRQEVEHNTHHHAHQLWEGEPVEDMADAFESAFAASKDKQGKNKSETPKTEHKGGLMNNMTLDRNAVIGLIAGAIIGYFITHRFTKDRKKAFIGAIIGAALGGCIAFFIGRSGYSKGKSVGFDETEATTDAKESDLQVKEGEQLDKADGKEHLKLGEVYDFTVVQPTYAMMLGNGTFYVARDMQGKKLALRPKVRYKGKLVHVKQPKLFMVDGGKVRAVTSRKPIPFLRMEKNLFVPLAATNKSSLISEGELDKFLQNKGKANADIFVKGRYAGKKKYFLLYFPAHESKIRQRFGQPASKS